MKAQRPVTVKRLAQFITLLSWIGLLPSVALAQFQGCFDRFGTPVLTQTDPSIPDVAQAALPPNFPVIRVNPGALVGHSFDLYRFAYFHECGHLALQTTNEQAADCFAIDTLVKLGNFCAADIQRVQQEIAAFGRGDWTHFPGPVRAINLIGCLQAAGEAPVYFYRKALTQKYAPRHLR